MSEPIWYTIRTRLAGTTWFLVCILYIYMSVLNSLGQVVSMSHECLLEVGNPHTEPLQINPRIISSKHEIIQKSTGCDQGGRLCVFAYVWKQYVISCVLHCFTMFYMFLTSETSSFVCVCLCTQLSSTSRACWATTVDTVDTRARSTCCILLQHCTWDTVKMCVDYFSKGESSCVEKLHQTM